MVDYRQDPEFKTKIEKREDISHSFICPKKHYVRRNGWLVVANRRKATLSSRQETDGYIRYFSLCGREAIDILLFELENIIRSTNRGYPDTCYCDFSEQAPKEFAILKEALGNTKGFNKKFEILVDDPKFIELIQTNPFDIINLDFCGNCFPKFDEPDSRTLRSIEQILNLQSNVSFDLFVTFRTKRSEENLTAIRELLNLMNRNFEDYSEILTAYNNYVGIPVDDLSDNDYPLFLLTTIPKIILGFANNFHLSGICSHRFFYDRQKKISADNYLRYKIVKFIFSFNPLPNRTESFSDRSRLAADSTANYRSSIANYLSNSPTNVDLIINSNQPLKDQLNLEQQNLITTGKKFSI